MEKDWNLNHLGFVVRDMNRAMKYYEQLGIADIGPEKVLQAYDGNQIKVRIVKIGSLLLEFFEPDEGIGVSGRFLKERGEGINHMAFTVGDLEQEIEKLVGRGMKLMFRSEDPDFGRVAYVDTGEIAGVVMELVQPPKESAVT